MVFLLHFLFQEIPIIFVGNKSDVGLEERLVLKEDVAEWVFCEMPKMKTKVRKDFLQRRNRYFFYDSFRETVFTMIKFHG